MAGRADEWRTLAAIAAAAGLGLVGRLVAGPTFGAVLWVGFVTPWVLTPATDGEKPAFSVVPSSLVLSAAACLSLVGSVGPAEWVRLVLLIALWVRTIFDLRRLASRWGGPDLGRCVVGLLWLGWWGGPVLLSQQPWAVPWIEYTPILLMMGQTPLLGDWTHQAIAYRYLTRLGQETAFIPPSPSAAIGMSIALFLLAHLVMKFGDKVKTLFHVEH